jgi:hypothetical protein
MEQEWKPNQPLPNADKAKIDPRKFEEYSLNPDNPNSQRKWIAFMTIGYDVNSSQGRHIATQDIINQLRATLPNAPAIQEQSNIYGLRFEVQVMIKGFNKQEGILITKWQIDRGEIIPRLISNWLKVPQSREIKNES